MSTSRETAHCSSSASAVPAPIIPQRSKRRKQSTDSEQQGWQDENEKPQELSPLEQLHSTSKAHAAVEPRLKAAAASISMTEPASEVIAKTVENIKSDRKAEKVLKPGKVIGKSCQQQHQRSSPNKNATSYVHSSNSIKPSESVVVAVQKRSLSPNLRNADKSRHREKRKSLPNPGTFPSPTSSSGMSRTKSVGFTARRSSAGNNKRRSSNRLSQQIINFTGFEAFHELKSVSMSLDWIQFKIRNGDVEAEHQNEPELFQAIQSKYCSLSVTNSNEILVRKPNAENILRIHSTIVEDTRNFDFYTSREEYIGSLTCDARQSFKIPSKLENKLTGEICTVTVQRDGDVKFWEIAFAPTNLAIANVKVHIGHRWKSVYKLTYLQEISISNQILLLGFLLALASARLESEVGPALLAFSAILVTFIIFFIIQFT